VGDHSIVDDYCYFSTRVRIGFGSHVANGCSIAGGVDRQFVLGDYSSLSAGVKVWCTSDDFVNDVVAICPPGIKENLIAGDVTIGDYTAVGANSVVMPKNAIPEGVAIGALSFVPAGFAFEPWSVYAGVPIRHLGKRNEANVRSQVARLDAITGRR
jgi:acetyltransferase-like isoleucine patch superfamily enzyme